MATLFGSESSEHDDCTGFLTLKGKQIRKIPENTQKGALIK